MNELYIKVKLTDLVFDQYGCEILDQTMDIDANNILDVCRNLGMETHPDGHNETLIGTPQQILRVMKGLVAAIEKAREDQAIAELAAVIPSSETQVAFSDNHLAEDPF